MILIASFVLAGAVAGVAASLWVILALADVNPTVHPDAVAGLVRYFATVYGIAGSLAGLALAGLLRLLARSDAPPRGQSVAPVLLLGVGVAAIGVAAPRLVDLAKLPEVVATAAPPAPAVADARVLVLGIDGLEWRELDRLIGEGELPNFTRLVDAGARSPLKTLAPTWSPLIWNTIATGVSPERHGILDFEQLRLVGVRCGPQRLTKSPVMVPRHVGFTAALRLGERLGLVGEAPVSGCHRKVKSVWNQLDDAGLRVAVINWFASYPAEPLDGYAVSDHNPMRAAFLLDRHGSLGDSTSPVTHPPDLLEELGAVALVTPAAPTPLAVLDHPIYADVPPEERESLKENEPLLAVAGQIIDSDFFAARVATKLLERERLPFLAVYMSGIDNISHRFGTARGVVRNFYRTVDGLIGEVLAAAGPGVTVVLVSDHGWNYDAEDFGHYHGPDGVFLLSGPGARAGVRLEVAPRVHDVAPTVLALFGLPVPEGLDGHVVREALEPARLALLPADAFDYGAYRAPDVGAPSSEPSALEDETMEKLRALGYVE